MKTRVCEFSAIIENQNCVNVSEGAGNFHKWGTTIFECEKGLSEVTVGIVEKEDGTVVLIPPESLIFQD